MRRKSNILTAAACSLGLLHGCSSNTNRPDGIANETEARARNLPIFVTALETSNPSRSGKVDVTISYINTSAKITQSVRFTLVARDATGASLRSASSNKFEAVLVDSKRIEPDAVGGDRWRNVWQNRRIVCSEILQTDIAFSDGTATATYADPRRRACR